ncbi:MAG: GIY-YIG nuclease family protein [Polyangiales bacterium]
MTLNSGASDESHAPRVAAIFRDLSVPPVSAPHARQVGVMWFVYRGINHTLEEIYYGVSTDPQARVNGSHCRKNTKTIQHWECDDDGIEWEIIAEFWTQKEASSYSHAKERQRAPNGCAGYFIHPTAGI